MISKMRSQRQSDERTAIRSVRSDLVANLIHRKHIQVDLNRYMATAD